jgi:hypothetical protein
LERQSALGFARGSDESLLDVHAKRRSVAGGVPLSITSFRKTEHRQPGSTSPARHDSLGVKEPQSLRLRLANERDRINSPRRTA